tara:strand:- start:135 stop:437 length:303 start_codon:yes stop_codon:yes gene_type:complete
MSKKPPIGLKPKKDHLLERLHEVRSAIVRYCDAELPIPVEWVEEYNELIKLEEDKSEERQKQNIEKTELEISEDLLKWKEERRQFNHQWENAFPQKIWPW